MRFFTRLSSGLFRSSVVILSVFLMPAGAPAVAAEPQNLVLVDTDIGSYLDDAFALGLVLASPEVKLLGVTTVGAPADERAWLACRFITQCERSGIPVAAGASPQPEGALDGQIQYRRHPAAIFNRTLKPVKQSAVELLHEQLSTHRGEVTILAHGPLTNVARLLAEHPEAKPWIREIVILGGELEGANGGLPEPEFNLKADVAASQAVFKSGVPLRVVTADTAGRVKFTGKHQQKLFTAYRPLSFQLHNLFELHGNAEPLLFDPVAVAAACGGPTGKWRETSLTIDEAGRSLETPGAANCRVLDDLAVDEFLDWMTERLATDGPVTLPRPTANRSKLVPLGKFPSRVHVFEDYDTDIERRWWMSGIAETGDVPPGGRRCCRAVLTEDFDDRQGDVKSMYRAVIFNPVPGPPMGPNTRLSFRYKLLGTSELRVQLYSLSNGYHRYLSLADLPQGVWSVGTVDMTQMRRPDGTGGPLSVDERIDDIQFYVDPRASVLIDDVMLYDAAADDELRPFPKRVMFTGWFDTGKQGKEWPGEFEIVPHEKPRAWKFARSVSGPDGKSQLIVSLRGPRRLSTISELSYAYKLTSGESFHVELRFDGKPIARSATARFAAERWEQGVIRFELPADVGEKFTDEIRFVIPPGGTLSIDDLLLYEP